ncbi:MAG: RtcB family protein [Candidatus Kapabacteria bacterium]|nr:RtcB family protein [Candidatus Kapabacteria bacterium]
MKEKLIKIEDYKWKIPAETSKKMKVPAYIFATNDMIDSISKDRSILQLMNVTSLPGIQSHALVMPDVHEGYGFPIGAVAATDLNDGVISPGGIGYDINCGIRLLTTDINKNDIKNYIKKISTEIFNSVPSGVGKSGLMKLSIKELDKVLDDGCRWAEKEGYTRANDTDFIESNGHLKTADSSKVSNEAKERGRDQLGTMGAGNHFIEIDYVEKVFDKEDAKIYNLQEEQIVMLIHTGSRGLGHQVATDYIKLMTRNLKKYNIDLPDIELACAPFNSEEGKSYFSAMCAAANFAWVNRQIITYQIRNAWEKVFGKSNKVKILYDVAHNIAKIEKHTFGQNLKEVIVHRKGATRAFPPNHPEIPTIYRKVGQPVLIPGSMGTKSYVLAGQEASMIESFGSACHGAGRLLSRTAAKKNIPVDSLLNELANKGILIQTGSLKGVTEEAPQAYKNVEQVVDVVCSANIAKRIARLKPIAVIKG